MSDMKPTIVPKSDQMNADDLITGPRTITIRDVKIAPGTEQPVGVFFNDDGGKPYLPCKSMRRVMVALWGPDASAYSGRSMTLYRDPSVTWGGMEVGGIRISHMSHIDKTTVVVLTATKKARKPFTVMPLVMQKPAAPPTDRRSEINADVPLKKRTWADVVADIHAIATACTTEDEALAMGDHELVKKVYELAGKATKEEVQRILGETYQRCVDAGSAAEPLETVP